MPLAGASASRKQGSSVRLTTAATRPGAAESPAHLPPTLLPPTLLPPTLPPTLALHGFADRVPFDGSTRW